MKTKILIPVDRGRNSLTAEEYAIKLNWRLPLSVTLLNVINTKRLEGHGISPDDQKRVRQAMQSNAEKVLAEAAEPFEKADLEYDTLIEEGNPAAMICKVAADHNYDMIIIAESGLGELEEILGGSVVYQVIHSCSCPVLLVKHSQAQLDRLRKRRAES